MKAYLLTQIAPENRLLDRLEYETIKAKNAFIAVSFIQKKGLDHLFKSIEKILNRGNKVTIYTSGYLRITEPEALEQLLKLTKEYDSLEVYFNPNDRFHAKFLLFEKPKKTYSLFLGSSNISVEGLAGVGELNIHIKGNTSDQIHRDIQIVINNLKKDRGFERIDEDLIERYKRVYKRRRTGKIVSRGQSRRLPPLEEMLVYVIKQEFSEKEMDKIADKQPKWGDYVEMTPELNRLKRKDHFLKISNIRGKEKTFAVSRFIEYDMIAGVGEIAHVSSSGAHPLTELAEKLRIKEKELLEERKLDIYNIATLKRDFKDDFA